MKRIILLLLIAGMALPSYARFSKATIQASGLTCALCSRAINKSLEKLPFVASVTADIKTSSFVVVFRKDMEPDIDALRNGVEDAGFSVARLQLTGDFTNLSVENDTHLLINGQMFHFLTASPQQLNGERVLTVVDKNFLQSKEFKKYAALSAKTCVQTGKAENCCHKVGVSGNNRIYHVTI